MSEIMDQLIEDSKIKSLALMLQDGISEEKACWYLQIPLEQREEMLHNAKTIQHNSEDNHSVEQLVDQLIVHHCDAGNGMQRNRYLVRKKRKKVVANITHK